MLGPPSNMLTLLSRLLSPIASLVSPRNVSSSTIPPALSTGVPGAPLRIPAPVRLRPSACRFSVPRTVPSSAFSVLSTRLWNRAWPGCAFRRSIRNAPTAADRESQQREYRGYKSCHACDGQRRTPVSSIDSFQLERMEWMDLIFSSYCWLFQMDDLRTISLSCLRVPTMHRYRRDCSDQRPIDSIYSHVPWR